MELYFFTRGIKNRVDETIKGLQNQWFSGRKYKGKTVNSQGSLRPIQFWAYSFPEPHLQEVLKMINPQPNYCKSLNKWGILLRKLLHAKKIPPIESGKSKRVLRKQFVQIWGIGIREDKFDDKGEEML